jgi:hypothetical protein
MIENRVTYVRGKGRGDPLGRGSGSRCARRVGCFGCFGCLHRGRLLVEESVESSQARKQAARNQNLSRTRRECEVLTEGRSHRRLFLATAATASDTPCSPSARIVESREERVPEWCARKKRGLGRTSEYHNIYENYGSVTGIPGQRPPRGIFSNLNTIRVHRPCLQRPRSNLLLDKAGVARVAVLSLESLPPSSVCVKGISRAPLVKTFSLQSSPALPRPLASFLAAAILDTFALPP